MKQSRLSLGSLSSHCRLELLSVEKCAQAFSTSMVPSQSPAASLKSWPQPQDAHPKVQRVATGWLTIDLLFLRVQGRSWMCRLDVTRVRAPPLPWGTAREGRGGGRRPELGVHTPRATTFLHGPPGGPRCLTQTCLACRDSCRGRRVKYILFISLICNF